ncbi:LOW QUALITY PROTEIN: F-box only protein 34 [Cottoperca gobio]|uniref:LOW QUALITY PROTEIN: F-box only protein 34 n=1 Tax=Cottoperca gobio TaxID=56716 RepID=A0A6J2S5A1_COTGO|nr:LOW QUALITY PROTEIN: F-box only protein 34 [Cottoperca gobio]
MHLKSYPKLVRSELRLDAAGVQTSQRSSLFVSHQGALLRTCSRNHGNSRLPFSVISTNTMRCSNPTNHNVSSSVASLCLKASPSAALQLLPPPGCENDALRLYQTAAEDADAPQDVWTVIKPGHVREKIAIFASDIEHTDSAGGSERTSTGGSDSQERTPAACTNHPAMSGLLRAVKAKGSWEENSSAKRRRRSGNSQNLQQDLKTRVQETQQHAHKPSPRRSDSTQRLDVEAVAVAVTMTMTVTATEEEEQKVSVVEMVAFLEQLASEQQPDSKPMLQRSSTTITLCRAPPPEVRGEEPESVRVLDMVAKLESECLKRRTEGDLSRSNSLRRAVGRVLLAAADQSSAPCRPSSPSSMTSSSSSLPEAQSAGREPTSCSEIPAALTTPPSGEATVDELGGAEILITVTETQTEAPPLTQASPLQHEEAEPLPGLLFLSRPPSSEPRPPLHRMTFDLELAPSQPRPPPARCDSGSQSEKKRRRRKADRAQEEEVVIVPLGRRASASQDFLLIRQRLQQLLEPQPYLAVLPHHLLLKIFRLLPTQSLATLKCTCNYFKFIIDDYGVRPADSLWVSDPRYRDDPCKQCKKRYGRGDVSLCRWHHKPYCQALPYGPGYWMCCHGARRDAPGCNVGLHDNRWVPAFHSINVPIYRSRRHED